MLTILKTMLSSEADNASIYTRPLTRSDIEFLTLKIVPYALTGRLKQQTVDHADAAQSVISVMSEMAIFVLNDLVSLITGTDQGSITQEYTDDFPVLFKIALAHQVLLATFPGKTLDQILQHLVDIAIIQARNIAADTRRPYRDTCDPLSEQEYAALDLSYVGYPSTHAFA